MNLQRAWLLLLGAALIGCADTPEPAVVKPKPQADTPKPVVTEEKPVASQPKSTGKPPKPVTVDTAEWDAEQKAAIAVIKKLGGAVGVDDKRPGKLVVWVRLTGPKVTDAGLVHLKGLTQLQELYLWDTEVSGVEDIEHGPVAGITEFRQYASESGSQLLVRLEFREPRSSFPERAMAHRRRHDSAHVLHNEKSGSGLLHHPYEF